MKPAQDKYRDRFVEPAEGFRFLGKEESPELESIGTVSESKLPTPDVLTAAFARHRRLTASQAREAFGSHITALVESGQIKRVEGWLGGTYYERAGK